MLKCIRCNHRTTIFLSTTLTFLCITWILPMIDRQYELALYFFNWAGFKISWFGLKIALWFLQVRSFTQMILWHWYSEQIFMTTIEDLMDSAWKQLATIQRHFWMEKFFLRIIIFTWIPQDLWLIQQLTSSTFMAQQTSLFETITWEFFMILQFEEG